MGETSQIAVDTSQGALDFCIEVMKGAAVLDLAEGVEEWLRKNSQATFNANLSVWTGYRQTVIAASCAIGQVAHILATLGNHREINLAVMKDAVRAVRNHCVADVDDPALRKQRRALCPDPDAP